MFVKWRQQREKLQLKKTQIPLIIEDLVLKWCSACRKKKQQPKLKSIGRSKQRDSFYLAIKVIFVSFYLKFQVLKFCLHKSQSKPAEISFVIAKRPY